MKIKKEVVKVGKIEVGGTKNFFVALKKETFFFF